jgi:hypothetical protein
MGQSTPSRFFIDVWSYTRAGIDDLINKVAETDLDVWWRFEHSGEVFDRRKDDLGNIGFQMGQTLGAKGKLSICAHTDEELVAFRMKVGL